MTARLLSPENCACFAIRRAARRITQAYDRALAGSGLQATQFTVLAVLDGCGEDGGIAMTALAGRLGMDRTTLTRNLALIEKAGWIAIGKGEDRRERLIALTAAGRQKFEAALPDWKAAQRRLLAGLGEAGLNQILAIAGTVDAPDR